MTARGRSDPSYKCEWVFGLMLAVSGCSSESTADAKGEPTWQLVLDDLPGALISVSGTAEDDVWLVGSDAGDGHGALVLHFDGEEFQRVAVGVDGDLWWVHAQSADRVYFGGTDGSIVFYDGNDFAPMDTPGTDTVFGIWAADEVSVWAVGGDPSREGRAFAWSLSDAGAWEPADVPDLGVSSYFKVWGTSSEDVRIVGADGVILGSDGGAFRAMDSPAKHNLTTVHASPKGTFAAVGGFGDGLILEDAGEGWRDRTPGEPPKQLFGVWLSSSDGYAVGANGTVLRRVEERWRPDTVDVLVTLDLHATWIDPEGGAWAVGGDLVSTPMSQGMLLYRGENPPRDEWMSARP